MVPKTAADFRSEYQSDLVRYFDELTKVVAETVESPIEELMIWSLLWQSAGSQYLVAFGSASHLPGGDPDHRGVTLLDNTGAASWERDFHLQPMVRVGESRYRLDIAMELRSGEWPRAQVFVAVECDGHDFHEKTKEQAERDKRRDRDLQSIGWAIARFTGSEIVRDPIRAGRDVATLAYGLLHKRELAEAEIVREIEAKRGGR
jgi:hypothetical protein